MELAVFFLICAMGFCYAAGICLLKWRTEVSVGLICVGLFFLVTGALGLVEIVRNVALGRPVDAVNLASEKPRHFKQTLIANCDEIARTNHVVLQELELDPHALVLQPTGRPVLTYVGGVEWLTNELVTIWRNESGSFGIRPIMKMTYDAVE
jgi:hypothetical protein